jgi:hypothetical protein
MSFDHPKAGPNSVPSYQLSGVPYLTGSTNGSEGITAKQFDFPQVTRFITFSVADETAGKSLKVGFSSEGLGSPASTSPKHFLIIPQGHVVTLDVRCKSVFVTTSGSLAWSMCAGLTPIMGSSFPVLTGSNGFYGIGGAPSGSIDGRGW